MHTAFCDFYWESISIYIYNLDRSSPRGKPLQTNTYHFSLFVHFYHQMETLKQPADKYFVFALALQEMLQVYK